MNNDLTGTVADGFPAAAISRMYKNEMTHKLEEHHWPPNVDLDRLYEIDVFGLYEAYKYFIEENNPAPNNEPMTLSFLLEYDYNDNFPIPYDTANPP